MSEILPKLQLACNEVLGVSEEEVIPTARFEDDFGADSLDMVELVMQVEKDFEIEISELEWDRVLTVQDALDVIERRQLAAVA